jgi:cytidine deaminase
LVKEALTARERAYAPYSRFLVGAALRTTDGTIVTGCNVENASYGLCVCAERNAINTLVAQLDVEHRTVMAIAVATASSPPSPPCGMCRQVLAELAPDARVVLVNTHNDRVRTTVQALLPRGFTPEQLESGRRQGGTRRRRGV